jgi:hypothetical protein
MYDLALVFGINRFFRQKISAAVTLLAAILLTGCGQTTETIVVIEPTTPALDASSNNIVIEKADPNGASNCPIEPKILRSTAQFIKVEHAMSQFESSKALAQNWCGQFDKLPDFSTQSCDKCCTSNFQCR